MRSVDADADVDNDFRFGTSWSDVDIDDDFRWPLFPRRRFRSAECGMSTSAEVVAKQTTEQRNKGRCFFLLFNESAIIF